MRWIHISLPLCAFALPVMSRALAISALNQVFPAATTANTFVRIYSGNAAGWGAGSGTVIERHYDDVGHGGWLCVLTADHVIAPATGVGAFTQVAFGNAGGGGATYDSRVVTINSLRGPMYDTDHRVDLGILGVRIDDMRTLPDMVTPFLGSPRIGDHGSFVAGYGLTATLDGPGRRYLVNEGTYGTMLASFSVWREQPIYTIGDYRYEAVRYQLEFGPTDPTVPAVHGTAHTLPGDSGGPSWSDEAFTWTLNGVHGASNLTTMGGGRVANEGANFWDVKVASYRDWIRSGCTTVVPEPASLATIGIGLCALIARRRKIRR